MICFTFTERQKGVFNAIINLSTHTAFTFLILTGRERDGTLERYGITHFPSSIPHTVVGNCFVPVTTGFSPRGKSIFTKNKDFPRVRFKEVLVSQLEEDETLWQFLSWHIPSASGLLMRKHCARQSSKISHTVRAKMGKHVVTEEAKEIALDVYLHDILLLLELIGGFISCAQRHSWIGCLNTKTNADQNTSLPL